MMNKLINNIFFFIQRRIQNLTAGTEERLSRIELSTKVLDSADRLRDTLVRIQVIDRLRDTFIRC
jgi:hypothetical protein